MNDPRPVKIVQPRPVRADDQTLAFHAQDANGDLQVYVTAAHWQALMAEAPAMADDGDRLDYALSRLEAQAVGREVGVAGGGARVVLVG